jgi:hypothetical protein
MFTGPQSQGPLAMPKRPPLTLAVVILSLSIMSCLGLIVWACVDADYVERLNRPALLAIVTGCLFVLPAAFLFGLRGCVGRTERKWSVSLVSGALMGLWFSCLLAGVPYLGVYFSLPVLRVGLTLSGGSPQGPVYFGTITVFNVVLWAILVRLMHAAYWGAQRKGLIP